MDDRQAPSTPLVLTSGGDERLTVDWHGSGVNQYFTSPLARPDVIVRSSCTASPSTLQGLAVAEAAHQRLHRITATADPDAAFDDAMESLRYRLGDVLGLAAHRDDYHTILTPSGTDAEMVICQMALAHSNALQAGAGRPSAGAVRVHNIFVAADEIGSGSVRAGGLQYFNRTTPDGSRVTVGPVDERVASRVRVSAYPARSQTDPALQSMQALEAALAEQVRISVTEQGQVVILHLVGGSKTGLSTPRLSFLQRMKQTYGEHLVAVVDLAQMRCKIELVRTCLQNRFCVLLTGSKFFGGPPFCGAVLIPVAETRLPAAPVPGLGRYLSRFDVDVRLAELRDALPTRRNHGLFLRWHVALDTMERYQAIDPVQRDTFVAAWLENVRQTIAASRCLHLFEPGAVGAGDAPPFEIPAPNTIVSVMVSHPGEERRGRFMGYPALQRVYRWMATDISGLLPHNADKMTRGLARRKCLLGQPVDLYPGSNSRAVLRIALGAVDILRGVQGPTQAAQVLQEDRQVIAKLALIAEHDDDQKK